jgi:MFS family permease
MSLFFLAKNLSFGDIGILFAVFSLSGFLFEIPTGYVGDKYGRKLSVLIGLIILTVTAFIWTLLQSVLAFAIFAGVWMLGLAFISGSFEGYIYDYLKSKGKEDYYDTLLAKSGSTVYAAGAIGSIVGAFLFSLNVNYPYYLLSGLFFTCFIVTLFMDGDPKIKDDAEEPLKIFSGIKYIYSHKSILWMTLFVALLFGYFSYFRGSVDKPYILSLGVFDVKWLGVFVAFSMIIQSLLISQFQKLKTNMKDLGMVIFYWTLSSIPLFIMSVGYGYVALLGMLMFYSTESFQETMLNSYSQKHIPSKIRATTLSSMKVYINCVSAILGLIAGYMFSITSIRSGMMISFVYTVLVLVIALSVKRFARIAIS